MQKKMKVMFVTLAREEEPKGVWNTPRELNNFLKIITIDWSLHFINFKYFLIYCLLIHTTYNTK